jgi:hypothetical protein
MKNNKLLAFIATLGVSTLGVSTLAHAHEGQRVWVDVGPGTKLVTLAGPDGGTGIVSPPAAYTPSRIFVRDMGATDDDGVNYQTNFPGYERTPYPSGSMSGNISFDIDGPLLYFIEASGPNPAFFQPVSLAFASAPAVPQFIIEDELTNAFVTSTGFVTGGVAFTAGSHGHPVNTLSYPGVDDISDQYDGVYAVPFQLRGGGAAHSDTFFVLFGRNATLAELDNAEAVALATLVPEPSSLALFVIVFSTALRRNRRGVDAR